MATLPWLSMLATGFRNLAPRRSRRLRRRSAPPAVEMFEDRLLLSTTPLLPFPPAHSSFPGASKTLYLDFDGHSEAAYGDQSNINIDPYNRPGSDPSTFDIQEQADILGIFERVAEDFAPFSINVTTVNPGSFANGVALRVVIGGHSLQMEPGISDAAGFTWVVPGGVFLSGDPNVVFAFAYRPGGATFYSVAEIANTASHEAGHGFGLLHQLEVNAAGNLDFHRGGGDKAPLMGYPAFPTARTTWWNGLAQGFAPAGPGVQDEMAFLAQVLGWRNDDHSSQAAGATSLTFDPTSQRLVGSGIVEQMSDTDWFTFVVHGDRPEVRIEAELFPLNPGGNLDPTLALYDAWGNVRIDLDDNPASLAARLELPLAPGEYRLSVGSHGARSPIDGYGDVGQYRLTLRDKTGPRIVSAVHLSGRRLRLTFDEPIDPASLDPLSSVEFVDAVGNKLTPPADSVQFQPFGTNGRVYDLVFPDFGQSGFGIKLGPQIRDRFGNLMDQDADGSQGEPGDADRFVYQDLSGPRVTGSEILSDRIRVSFGEPIDVPSFTAAQVTLTDLNGAAAAFQAPKAVVGTGNMVWDIPVPSYPTGGFVLTLKAGIRDEFGNRLNQDGDAVNGEVPSGEGPGDWYVLNHTDAIGPRVIDAFLAMPQPIVPAGVGPTPSGTELFLVFDEPIRPDSFDAADVEVRDALGNLVPVLGVSSHSGMSVFPAVAASDMVWFVSLGALGFGTFTFTIGPNVTDYFHNPMDQNGNGVKGEATDTYSGEFTLDPTVLDKPSAIYDDEIVKFLALQDRWKLPEGGIDLIDGWLMEEVRTVKEFTNDLAMLVELLAKERRTGIPSGSEW